MTDTPTLDPDPHAGAIRVPELAIPALDAIDLVLNPDPADRALELARRTILDLGTAYADLRDEADALRLTVEEQEHRHRIELLERAEHTAELRAIIDLHHQARERYAAAARVIGGPDDGATYLDVIDLELGLTRPIDALVDDALAAIPADE